MGGLSKNISRRFPPLKRHDFWKDVADNKWNDWVWQQQNRVKRLDQLERLISLTPEERAAFLSAEKKFRIAITPYYLSLIDRDDPMCPIRRQAVPQPGESRHLLTELEDPSGEDSMAPAPGIVHRYPDRVLLYTTHNCAVYCRFCTRKRKVSNPDSAMSVDDLTQAIDYIRSRPEVREVIVSGGDALSNSDERLFSILSRLRAIDHVEIIRIGSRNLVTLPQRVTREFSKTLSDFAPVFVHTHFNHPNECTSEALEACSRLVESGIPLNNHTVLLKGINDRVETMRELNLKLLMMRVRPYYLYQCDRVYGNSEFRTTINQGREIIRALRGWSSGLAVPHFVIDTAGGGKVPLLPNYIVSEDPEKIVLRNYQGKEYSVPLD